MALNRLLPLSGIVFVVLALVAVVGFGGSTPGSDASGAEVRSFYDAHGVRQAIAAFVLAASVPFLLFFAARLVATVAPAEEGTTASIWRFVLIGGSILAGAALLVTALVHFALADGADHAVSAAALQALNVMDADSWIAFNAGFGVMMLGAAGSLLARAAGHRWLGWASLVLGIALFIPFADFFALLLTLVWIIVTSLMLFRERLRPTYAAAPDAASRAG